MYSPEFAALLWQEWERCLPVLSPAIRRSEGAFDAAHVWSELVQGNAQLWPLWKGRETQVKRSAMVTRIEIYPSGRKAVLGWLAGGEMDECRTMQGWVEDWARAMGCERFEIIGRRGWLRALEGFRESQVVLTKDL